MNDLYTFRLSALDGMKCLRMELAERADDDHAREKVKETGLIKTIQIAREDRDDDVM